MVYKQFNIALSYRLAAIVLLALAIGLSIGFLVDWLYVAGLIIVEVVVLTRFFVFVNQTNSKINYFIQAVKNEDTTLVFPEKTGNHILNELHASLNELNKILKDRSIRIRMKERYFSEILQHIGTAIVVFNEKGFVINTNQAALKLFGLQVFTHLVQLDKVDALFRRSLSKIGDSPFLSLSLKKNGELIQLSVRCSEIKLRDETVTLVTLQDIRGELESKELDSWSKLIKVLNHEIMNSLAPVTSIAQSLGAIWKGKTGAGFVDAEVVKTVDGLGVIEERGEALMRFVQSYRMFTKMPELKLSEVSMCALIDRLSILVSPLKDDRNVTIHFTQPSADFVVRMDEHLMVQVIINLVKNSVHAVKDVSHPLVEVTCKPFAQHSAEILVRDNGIGIPAEIKDEIFIPFFTTKTDGSGIGLSYSRQILRAHGGTIFFSSTPGATVFTVRW